MTEIAEVAGANTGEPVAEMIGRYVVAGAQLNVFRSRARVKTVDETIPDYEFYDRLRRCKAEGFTLAGLFCARIERILAAWVLGDGVTVTLHEGAATGTLAARRRDYTNGLLAEFIAGLLDAGQDEAGAALEVDAGQGAQLLALYRDSLGLGDQYVIMNVDGTLSIPSPDTVTIQRNMLDYRRWDAVIVVTKLNGWEITDEYRRLDRTVTYKEGGEVRAVQTYPNLLGVIPVVGKAIATLPLLSSHRDILLPSTALHRIKAGNRSYIPFRRKSSKSPASVSVRLKMPMVAAGRKSICHSA